MQGQKKSVVVSDITNSSKQIMRQIYCSQMTVDFRSTLFKTNLQNNDEASESD